MTNLKITSTMPRWTRIASVCAALGFTLAACGGGGDEPSSGDQLPDDTATTTITTTTTVSTTTTSPPPVVVVAAEPEADPDTAPEPEPPGTDGACLVGDWKVADAELNSYYEALAAGTGPETGLSLSTTGEVLMSFTETSYEYIGDFDLMLSVGGVDGTGEATGSVDGTWVAEDGIILTELGSSDLNIVVTVSGVTIDGSDFGNGLVQANPLNNAPFTCDGPTLMFQSGPDDTTRHPVLLTPA
jgi:hypothetical protein